MVYAALKAGFMVNTSTCLPVQSMCQPGPHLVDAAGDRDGQHEEKGIQQREACAEAAQADSTHEADLTKQCAKCASACSVRPGDARVQLTAP